MHVHHHPTIHRKDLRDYIFEGLMIFMAVTLGFFAEKIRENFTERSKEKEFVVSMIEDVQTDIANIDKSIAINKIRVLKLDTLANYCFNYKGNPAEEAAFYTVIKFCIRHPDFVSPVERTMFQLKNSGGMRLIEDKAAADSIIFYDDVAKKMLNQQNYYDFHLNNLIDATEKLINLKYFPLNHQTLKWENDAKGLATAQLISHDKDKITEFGNKAKLFQGIVMFYITRLEEARLHGNFLIETLKKAYHIK